MIYFYMAVGVAGSGKSVYGQNLKHLCDLSDMPFEIISSDAIREEVFGDVNDQSHNQKVFEIMYQRSVEAIAANKIVYYDACNISAKKRRNFIKNLLQNKKIADKKIKLICDVFCPPIEICFENNRHRERVVPEHVIKNMYLNFEPPHYSEGWNEIHLQNNISGKNGYFEGIVESNKIPHDNPHHKLSVADHMNKAFQLFEKDERRQGNDSIANAIKYHDIGKSFCKVFKNAKGEKSDIAHYYHHENVGAYLILAYSCGDSYYGVNISELIEIANLVAHHMDFFKGNSYLEKVKNLYGEDFFNKLKIVHEFDLLAH